MSAAGKVHAVVLALSANTKRTSDNTSQRDAERFGVSASMNRIQARSDEKKKTPINTFLRSVTHATDSTWTGCKANRAAPNQAAGTFSMRSKRQRDRKSTRLNSSH